MSRRSCPRWLLGTLALLAMPAMGSPASPDDGAAACARQLHAIGRALAAFERDHGALPPYLSDLYPRYVADRKLFHCPADASPGQPVFAPAADPKLPVSYIYQMSERRDAPGMLLGPRPKGGRAVTWRRLKLAQRVNFGDRVPVVSCWHHHRPPFLLNLTLTGHVYRCVIMWETDPETVPAVVACLERDVAAGPRRFRRRWQPARVAEYFTATNPSPALFPRLRRVARHLSEMARSGRLPAGSDFESMLGGLYFATRDRARAISAFEAAMKRSGDHRLPADLLVSLYIEARQYERAIRLAHSLLAHDRENAHLMELLANAYEAAGQRDRASEWRRRMDPGAQMAGRAAPGFALADTTGRIVRLSDHHGEILFLGFGSVWVDPCRAAAAILEALHREYGRRGLVILGLSRDRPHAPAVEFRAKTFTYPLVLDADRVFELYHVRGLPCIFVIDGSGRVVSRHLGYSADLAKTLAEELQRLRAPKGSAP
jgi:peroxiredoxin/tetratricopeptide (TPR) repeat protein